MRTSLRRCLGTTTAATLILGALAAGAAAAAPAPASTRSAAHHAPAPRSTRSWTRSGLVATLTADAGLGATIGYSAALSADGSTAVLGAPDADDYDGAVYVFHRTGTTWAQDAVLTQSDAQYAQIGFGVDVSDDGRTIVAGASGSGGRVYVFTKPDTTWSQSAEFTAPPGGGYGTLYGTGVSISGDGSTIAAGAYFRDSGKGSVFVYDRTSDGWSDPSEVTASDAADYDYFGYDTSISLDRDGKTLAVGAMGKDDETGALYTFTADGSTWTQAAELTASDGAAGDRFAQAVSISGDGRTIVAGAPYHGTGVGYVFTRSGDAWASSAELQPGGKRDFMSDAIAVSTSGDGSVVALGLPSRNEFMGAGALFVRGRDGYAQKATAVPSEFNDGTGGTGTGIAVSADGRTALLGAPTTLGSAFQSGAAFVYQDGARPGPGVTVGTPVAPSDSATTQTSPTLPKGVTLPPGLDLSTTAKRVAVSKTVGTPGSRATSRMHVSKLAGHHPILGIAHRTATACTATPRPGFAACSAQLVTDGSLDPLTTSTYEDGYTPAQLQTAYKLKGLTGSSLVAVVDAFANPDAQASLNTYRQQFGLGPIHLTQVGQDGSGQLPAANTGWGTEEMLDLEMVSAACPSCSILYVGANSASFDDLGAAVNTAVRMGAKVVSNSYGGAEEADEVTTIQKKYYDHPGVALTASTGDGGYGVSQPAAFDTVVAVGGTSLTLDSSGSRTGETAWGSGGSGCSRFVSKPRWQRDGYCAHRTVADVAAVADPDTGVAVYDIDGGGWLVAGGTSVSAPLIGGIYGLTGDTAGQPARRLYGMAARSLYDVRSGIDGTCSADYLCSGGAGFDGPTGVGSPNGVGAF